jgi:FAD/FMN-containing dehydrogenase
MIRRAIAMDGTVTGEHGVGLKKREYIREELGEDTVDAMRKVCSSLSRWNQPADPIFPAQASI